MRGAQLSWLLWYWRANILTCDLSSMWRGGNFNSQGGAIYAHSGGGAVTVTILDTKFESNKATGKVSDISSAFGKKETS